MAGDLPTESPTARRLTPADFVIKIPGPSLACLLRDCGNCVSTECTHDCPTHQPEGS